MPDYADLHTHYLPGVDDGVHTVEDALTCLRAAAASGYRDVALTRHEMAGVYGTARDKATTGRQALQRAVEEAGIPIRLHDGAEYYADDVFLTRLRAQSQGIGEPLQTLGGGNVLLIEFSLMGLPPFAADVSFRIRVKGYAPLLAHVERYREVQEDPRRAKELSEAGFLLQVNLGSLSGVYGRRVERAARSALDAGLIFCCASDSHGPKWVAPTYERGIKELESWGSDAVSTLLSANPRRALGGESL